MLTRDRILDILRDLELWYWPVFFWNVWWFERYYAAYRAENPKAAIAIAVTRQGRIVITFRAAADTPDPADWTQFAPRAPWAKLDLELLASAFSGLNLIGQDSDGFQTVSGLFSDSVLASHAPLYLDPG